MTLDSIIYLSGLATCTVIGAVLDSIDLHKDRFDGEPPMTVIGGITGLLWPVVFIFGVLFLPVYGCHRFIGLFVTKPQPKIEGIAEAEQEVEAMLKSDIKEIG